jgi:hypothetical protein
MKTIIKFIIWIIIICIWFYVYNKTLWVDKTDCMIQYINNYYPYWSTYNIPWSNDKHIDKRWLDYLDNEKEIYGCIITNWVLWTIYNTPYCYITLFFERLIFN